MAMGPMRRTTSWVRIDGVPLMLAMLLAGKRRAAFGICSASQPARRPLPRGGDAGRSSCRDWAFLRIGWFSTISSSGFGVGAKLEVLGWVIDSPKYLFCLAFVVVFAVIARTSPAPRSDRQWMAIRDDMDVAAEVIGIRPMFAKLSAFAVSSFFVGVAGALWGFVHLGSWEPAAFSVDRSFQLLFMVIIGGMGSIMGSFFGAAFIVILPIFLNQFLPLPRQPGRCHRRPPASRMPNSSSSVR